MLTHWIFSKATREYWSLQSDEKNRSFDEGKKGVMRVLAKISRISRTEGSGDSSSLRKKQSGGELAE